MTISGFKTELKYYNTTKPMQYYSTGGHHDRSLNTLVWRCIVWYFNTKLPAVWKSRSDLSSLWPLAPGRDERIISAREVSLRQRPPPQAHTLVFCSVLLAQLAHSTAYWGPRAAVETHPEVFSSSAWNILYRCWCAIKTQHCISSIRQLQIGS